MAYSTVSPREWLEEDRTLPFPSNLKIQTSAALPTDHWAQNLLLADSSSIDAFPIIYFVDFPNNKVGITHTVLDKYQLVSIQPDYHMHTYALKPTAFMLEVGMIENPNETAVTHLDPLTAIITTSSIQGSLDVIASRGCAYANFSYNRVTPLIRSSVITFTKINNREVMFPYVETHHTFILEDNEKNVWGIFADPKITLSFTDPRTLESTTSFSGIIQVAHIGTTSDPSLSSRAKKFTQYSGTIGVECSVKYKVKDSLCYTFEYETIGRGEGMLWYALPHHDSTLSKADIEKVGLPFDSYPFGKVDAWLIKSSKLRFQSQSLPLDIYGPSIPSSKRDIIISSLRVDLTDEGIFERLNINNDDTGRVVAAVARLCLISKQLSVSFDRALELMCAAIERWFSTLRYDLVWGGVMTSGSYKNRAVEFGYWLYGIAIASLLNSKWAKQHRDKILCVARDVANPSGKDVYFPVLRNKDWYGGGSLMSGLEESPRELQYTGETMNCYYSIWVLGKVLGITSMQDAGVATLTTEIQALSNYFNPSHSLQRQLSASLIPFTPISHTFLRAVISNNTENDWSTAQAFIGKPKELHLTNTTTNMLWWIATSTCLEERYQKEDERDVDVRPLVFAIILMVGVALLREIF